jgi:tetratricopeptide (TPR) repeat protein
MSMIRFTVFIIGLAIFAARAHEAAAQDGHGDATVARPSDSASDEQLNNSDEAFIKDGVAEFGDRRAASRALALQGWVSMRESKIDLALQRFRESRLLDPKNYQAYWGYGAVLSEEGRLSEAIEQLEIARELIGGSGDELSLLSDMGALYSQYAARLAKDRELERARGFIAANQCFAESLEMDHNYARSWREWAISLYDQQRFSEAWIKAQRAIELKADPFPRGFLNALQEKVSRSR